MAQLRQDIRLKVDRLNGFLGRLQGGGGADGRPKTGRATRIQVDVSRAAADL